jgi:hypothetical protein
MSFEGEFDGIERVNGFSACCFDDESFVGVELRAPVGAESAADYCGTSAWVAECARCRCYWTQWRSLPGSRTMWRQSYLMTRCNLRRAATATSSV